MKKDRSLFLFGVLLFLCSVVAMCLAIPLVLIASIFPGSVEGLWTILAMAAIIIGYFMFNIYLSIRVMKTRKPIGTEKNMTAAIALILLSGLIFIDHSNIVGIVFSICGSVVGTTWLTILTHKREV